MDNMLGLARYKCSALCLGVVLFFSGACGLFAQVADAWEDDDSFGTASNITAGVEQERSIYPAGDDDWIAIAVKDGHEYRVETYKIDISVDTKITIYSSDGITPFAADDDGGIDPLTSMVEFTAPGDGTMYAKIELAGAQQTATRNYGVRMTDLTESGEGGSGAGTIYGSTTASGPAIATDGQGWPVIVYTDVDSNGVEQVYLKRWQGLIGQAADRGEWASLVGGWAAVDGTADDVTQVSSASGEASYPSVAVNGKHIYVAWMNRSAIDATARIYVRHWDGYKWHELGGSMTGDGVSPAPANNLDKDSSYPTIKVDSNGRPVVCFQHSFLSGSGVNVAYSQAVLVKRYNSTSETWAGMDGSTDGVVPGGELAFDPSMDLDGNGYPVVAWGEPAKLKVRSRKWNGSSWTTVGGGDLGRSPFAEKPHIAAADNGTVYLAWRQYHVPSSDLNWLMTYDVIQLNVVQASPGGTWRDVGGAYSGEGLSAAVSGGAERPDYISIDVDPTTGYPVVCWLAGETDNAVLLKQWNGSAWVGVDGSDVNGVADMGGDYSTPDMTIDEWGRLAVVFMNTDSDGGKAVYSYKIVGEEPPEFEGLRFAVGGQTTVTLRWDVAESPDSTTPYTTADYRIYRSQVSVPIFAETPVFTPEQVFEDGILIREINDHDVLLGTVEYVYSVTAEDRNKTFGFGVRAGHNDFWELNEVIRYAGASNIIPAASLPVYDLDGDGLDDADEISIYGSSPYDADGNDNDVSDGDEFQAGWDPNDTTNRVLFNYLLTGNESSFGADPGTWAHTSTRDLWHWTTADPEPPTTPPLPLYSHTMGGSFRCAKNNPANNTSTTYSMDGLMIKCALVSPTVNPRSDFCTNLFVGWNEYYETEAEWDICKVSVSYDGINYILVRPGVSGYSGGWKHSIVDISDWWRDNGNPDNVRVKFEFETLSATESGNRSISINDDYGGWYVDDVRIYGTPGIMGNVRNVRGKPLVGVALYAIGKGTVANKIDGHTYVNPGKIFAFAVTDEQGNYELKGMPQGRYYIKAKLEGYMAECWNGTLYAGSYNDGTAYNNEQNEGVHDIRDATAGLVDLTVNNASRACNFEMDGGTAKSILAVRGSGDAALSRRVYINQVVEQEEIWNGETAAASRDMTDYHTGIADTNGYPDLSWDNNAYLPPEISDIMSGIHNINLHPGWSDASWYSKATPELRTGEKTKVTIGTETKSGTELFVVAGDGGQYPIYINGRDTGEETPRRITGLLVGYHDVLIRPGDANYGITPKEVAISTNGQVNVYFSNEEILGNNGGVTIRTYDVFGNAISNAAIYIDGFDWGVVTPTNIAGLKPGVHQLSVRREGYMTTRELAMPVSAGQTNVFNVTISQADRDYDDLGDGTETSGGVSIFQNAASGDADGDGLSNGLEYDQYELFGIRMNINTNDSDADGMSDYDELAYDGRKDFLAFSTLASNVPVRGTNLAVYFQGRYLDGTNHFSTFGRVSIEGDECYVTNMTWSVDDRNIPVMVYEVSYIGTDAQILSVSHELGETVFADGIPNDVDTDDDGMWDGFESLYEATEGLNVIDNVGGSLDPDYDGLTNIREFWGTDGLPTGATNKWCNPGKGDSDDDSMPDGWEINNDLNPLDAGDAEYDEEPDGLVNVMEWTYRTFPRVADSDGDGLLDGIEVNKYLTDPRNKDTDYDRLWDGQEVYDTDLNPDNGIDGGFFPGWSGGNLDADSFIDGPTDWDTDGDGMSDGFEVLDEWIDPNTGMYIIRPSHQRLDPYNPLDGTADPDGDGLSNLEEFLVRDAKIGKHPNDYVTVTTTNIYNLVSEQNGQIIIEMETEPTVGSWKRMGAYTNDGHMYVIDPNPVSFGDASNNATALFGHMAFITNAAENYFIYDAVIEQGAYAPVWWGGDLMTWLGGSDTGVEGTWLWNDGSPVTNDEWAAGQPNNGWGLQDNLAMSMVQTGLWDDVVSGSLGITNFFPYVVEYDNPVSDADISGTPDWREALDAVGSSGEYLGEAFYIWNGDTDLATEPTDDDEIITYYFEVTNATPTNYFFNMRHAHPTAALDIENRCWVRVDGYTWRETYILGSAGNWDWDSVTAQFEPGGVFVGNEYALRPGLHTIEIAGGSVSNALDRFYFCQADIAAPTDATPSSPYNGQTNVIVSPTDTGVIWSHSTNPFEADSDGDGMPDGFEVWRGLSPQDPEPNSESSIGITVLQERYWKYGDLDGDGLENIDEYEMRFINDPNADPNAVEGSCDPWDYDTDDDGVGDGEEVKTYRSNPIVQDSDGDGLIDSIDPTGIRAGEVNDSTDIYASNHYDRALNDLWVCNEPNTGWLTHWIPLMTDKRPELIPVFSNNVNGIIAIDITNAPMSVGWTNSAVLPEVFGGPRGYEWTRLINISSDDDNDDKPGLNQGPLEYLFHVTTPGWYNIKVHNQRGSSDYHLRSYWMSIDHGPWKIVRSEAGNWTWSTTVLREGLTSDVGKFFQSGLHRIAICGRGLGMVLDRIHIYPSTYSGPDPEDLSLHAASPPSATSIHNVYDRPPRRWGAAGAGVYIVVRDNTRGVYVGMPVTTVGETRQLLLSAKQFYAFGGRDGGHFYDDVWVLKNMFSWESIYEMPDMFYGAGLSELCSETFPQVSSPGIPGNDGRDASWYNHGVYDYYNVIRPRPGVPKLYRYYDGERDTQLESIWGDSGVVNMAPSFLYGGWDKRWGFYDYYPSIQIVPTYCYEKVVKWDDQYIDEYLPWYLHTDDHREARYNYLSDASAYQWITNSLPTNTLEVVYPLAWLEYNHIFGDTNVTYSGIHVPNVLNTIDSSQPGTLYATLRLPVADANANEMTVRIFAEVSLDEIGTAVDPLAHPTFTSDSNYGEASRPSAIVTDFTPYRRVTGAANPNSGGVVYRTPSIYRDIPVSAVGDVVGLDVTELVTNIFAHSLIDAKWEIANDIGFIIIPEEPAGSDRMYFGNAQLEIVADEPYWEWPYVNRYWEVEDFRQEAYTPNYIMILANTDEGIAESQTPFPRKMHATAKTSSGVILFGGVDGNTVLGDTWTSPGTFTQGEGGEVAVPWFMRETATIPPARWGHGITECNYGALMFGGFDENNAPLNDLWLYDFVTHNWIAITNFANNEQALSGGELVVYESHEKPRPRGGMMFENYKYPTVFGGTDGQFYFNDTWILNIGSDPRSYDLGDAYENPTGAPHPWRWTMTAPCGERSGAPPPRAFMTCFSYVDTPDPVNSHMYSYDAIQPEGIYMFGGRNGTLPTSEDTDNDWVSDGDEHALGGPAEGRDPRDSALLMTNYYGDSYVADHLYIDGANTNTAESYPFVFKRLGGIPANSPNSTNEVDAGEPRGLVADFESLSMPHSRGQGDIEWQHVMSMAVYHTSAEGKRIPPPTYDWLKMDSGYDGYLPSYTAQWWHPDKGVAGDWEIGIPRGTNPPTAWSGRWCFGTGLDEYYANDTVLELYSPLFSLNIPQPENDTTDVSNTNSFYLVFREWLDLADAGDSVRIMCVRPVTQADVVTRVGGTYPESKPDVTILPARNYGANTDGQWRRMVVSLSPVFNEENCYLKFMLESDETGRAAGWYIDDVAIVQAGEISGDVTDAPNSTLYLYGTNSLSGVPLQETEADNVGSYGFSGLLAAGNYKVYGYDGVDEVQLSASGWNISGVDLSYTNFVVGITVNSPALLTWNAIPDRTYSIQYATPESFATAQPWTELTTFEATGPYAVYRDEDSDGKRSRYYRIILLE